MTDRELIEAIRTMITRHLCDHRRQFLRRDEKIRIEEQICQDCGIVLITKEYE